MKSQKIDYEKLSNNLSKRITEHDRYIIEKVALNKKTVYTSFDGDYMHYLIDMQKYALDHGYIPVNPEAVLGYYVSTDTHGGKKIPVMMDCINIELFCDEMWVFTDPTKHFTEGVVAEMIIWEQVKNTDMYAVEFFPDILLCSSPKYGAKLDVMRNPLDFLTNSDRDIEEINAKLLTPYNEKHMQNAYIIANVRNMKHIDWARKYCYEHNITPVCPQTILPSVLYRNVQDRLLNTSSYTIDRLTLLSKSDSALYFVNTRCIDSEIDNLDYNSCCELYYLLYHHKDFRIIDWADAGVPKYLNGGKHWALTSTEAKEVTG